MKHIHLLLLLLPVLTLTACGGDDSPSNPDVLEVISFRDIRVRFVDSVDTDLTERTRVSILNQVTGSQVPFTLETFRGQRCIRFAASGFPLEIVVNRKRSVYIRALNTMQIVGNRRTVTTYHLYNGVNTGDSVATFLCIGDHVFLRHYAPELKFKLVFPRVRTDLIPKDNPCRLRIDYNGCPVRGIPDGSGRFIGMDATPIDDTYSKVTLLMGADVLYGGDGNNSLGVNRPLFKFDSPLFPFDDHSFEVSVEYQEDLNGGTYAKPRFLIQRVSMGPVGHLSSGLNLRNVVKPDNVIEIEVRKPTDE